MYIIVFVDDGDFENVLFWLIFGKLLLLYTYKNSFIANLGLAHLEIFTASSQFIFKLVHESRREI